MRTPEYLSPTSLALWEADRTEFYLKYLADNRPSKIPQTKPMAVGSAFDAYVKSYLVSRLFGTTDRGGVDYSLDSLLATQVDAHLLDWARLAGASVMALYQSTGALADLVLELESAITDPRFEFTISGVVSGVLGDVPFLGKPDLFFRTNGGAAVYDWKVNGWCSASRLSPMPGYIKCRMLGGKSKTHKNVTLMRVQGILINIACGLEDIAPLWATQETIYAWLLGVGVGEGFIAGIEQIVGQDRVSSLRNKVGEGFQHSLYTRAAGVWKRIMAGEIFDENNSSRIALLDDYQDGYLRDTTAARDWLEEVLRGSR